MSSRLHIVIHIVIPWPCSCLFDHLESKVSTCLNYVVPCSAARRCIENPDAGQPERVEWIPCTWYVQPQHSGNYSYKTLVTVHSSASNEVNASSSLSSCIKHWPLLAFVEFETDRVTVIVHTLKKSKGHPRCSSGRFGSKRSAWKRGNCEENLLQKWKMFPNFAVFVQSWPDQQEGVHQHTSGLSETITTQWKSHKIGTIGLHLDCIWITLAHDKCDE